MKTMVNGFCRECALFIRSPCLQGLYRHSPLKIYPFVLLFTASLQDKSSTIKAEKKTETKGETMRWTVALMAQRPGVDTMEVVGEG
jgi:hypothetical protein